MRPRCPGTRTHRGKTLVSGCALEASLRGRTMTPRPPRSPAKMAAARAQSRRGGARTRKSPWAGPRGSRSWARCSRGVLSRRCAVGQGTGRPSQAESRVMAVLSRPHRLPLPSGPAEQLGPRGITLFLLCSQNGPSTSEPRQNRAVGTTCTSVSSAFHLLRSESPAT